MTLQHSRPWHEIVKCHGADSNNVTEYRELLFLIRGEGKRSKVSYEGFVAAVNENHNITLKQYQQLTAGKNSLYLFFNFISNLKNEFRRDYESVDVFQGISKQKTMKYLL